MAKDKDKYLSKLINFYFFDKESIDMKTAN